MQGTSGYGRSNALLNRDPRLTRGISKVGLCPVGPQYAHRLLLRYFCINSECWNVKMLS